MMMLLSLFSLMLIYDGIGVFVASETPLNLKDHQGNECLRTCTYTTKPRVCYFNFTVEHYTAMGSACQDCFVGEIDNCFHKQCITVDGAERGVMSINRMIPGPSIQVCKGDEIVVDLINEAHGSAVTLHWHGIHQKNTPFMDGVPYVTQCPIPYGTTFRYKFSAAKAGTYFYHSHSGFHKANGQFGALVIREPQAEDPNDEFYQFDLGGHVLVASDWLHTYAENFVPGQPNVVMNVKSLLINGRGRYFDGINYTIAPLSTYRVKRAGKYRFRFINSASLHCPFQLQIENHTMQIIATDGHPMRPFFVNTLVSMSGERFDFVINANQTPGEYWIRMRAIGTCEHLNIQTFAVLSYSKEEQKNDTELAFLDRPFPKYQEPFEIGVMLNEPNKDCQLRSGKDCLSIEDMQTYPTIDDNAEIYKSNPDVWLNVKLNTHIVSDDELFTPNSHFDFMNVFGPVNVVGTSNDISFQNSPFSLLTQSDQIDESTFCNTRALPSRCQNLTHCFCLHRYKVPLNSIVWMRITDESPGGEQFSFTHPFHVHGHQFLVIDMGSQPGNSTGLDNKYPAFKDTVIVPGKGFVVIKFRADNPGFWLMHCHFEWHLGMGMSMVLQVGELNEMVQPPVGFPRCNNYQPSIQP